MKYIITILVAFMAIGCGVNQPEEVQTVSIDILDYFTFMECD